MTKIITAIAAALALFFSLTAEGCEPAPSVDSTMNQDNGDHEFQRTGGGRFVYGKQVSASLRWTQCRWKVQRKLKNEDWETVKSGTSSNAKLRIEAPTSTATRVRLHSSNCGKWRKS